MGTKTTRTQRFTGGSGQDYQDIGVVPGAHSEYDKPTPGEQIAEAARKGVMAVQKMYKGVLRRTKP